eukprot:m.60170 g.60170  ORF g.60170 m.60170 type:complete len:275 (+) comp34923_c0_seq4:477-1301(+)
MAVPYKVLIHPVALFSVLDAYQRRPEKDKRIIGTLLGVAEKGLIEVKAAFVVPHQESEEVHIDLEFASNMVDQHKKLKSKDVVVGWFATGTNVTEHSSLIHDYYKRASNMSPVHLTIDTSLTDARLGIKAYIGAPLGVPGKTQGTIFIGISHEVISSAPEKVAVQELQVFKRMSGQAVGLGSDLDHVLRSAEKMLTLLQQIIDYVDDVLAGKIPVDSSVGRMLFDAVANVPYIDTEQFEAMMTSSMEDLLTVVYLANLSRSQLALGGKLTSILV